MDDDQPFPWAIPIACIVVEAACGLAGVAAWYWTR